MLQTKNNQIAAYGVSAFDRMPSLALAENYTILQLKNKPVDTLLSEQNAKIVFFPFTLEEIGSSSTEEVLASLQFQKWYRSSANYFTHFVFFEITLKIQEIASQLGMKIIGPDPVIARKLENKIKIRSILPKQLFAPFEICETPKDAEKIISTLGTDLVTQIPDSAGGRGTFFTHSRKDFEDLVTEFSLPLLVSQRKNGVNASIQGVVLRNGTIFSTAPQLNYFGVEGLVSTVKDAGQFCGGEWGSSVTQAILSPASKLMQIIGKKLWQSGYCGIFGVDILIDTDIIWVIEINARQTGLTPILTYLCNQAKVISLLDLAVYDALEEGYTPDNAEKIQTDLIQATSQHLSYCMLYNCTSAPLQMHVQSWLDSESKLVGLSSNQKIITPGKRFGRLISTKSYVSVTKNSLNGEGREKLNEIYARMLKPIT